MSSQQYLALEGRRSGLPFLAGAAALTALTFVCFRYHVNSTTVGLLFLIVVVLVSLRASFLPAAIISLLAYLCLDYFFTEPLFTLGMSQTLDFVAPVAYIATALVITRLIWSVRRSEDERQRAEERLRSSQAELAHVSRVLTMGELAASIAHEINQPLTAIVTNGGACLRWLSAEEPDLEEARAAARRIVRDGHSASDIMTRIRAFLKKADAQRGPVDLNRTIQEVVALTRDQAAASSVTLRTEFFEELPKVLGDRVQLQQVVLNLVLNAIEATARTDKRGREIRITTLQAEAERAIVEVSDSGQGIDLQSLEHIFEPFYSTKAEGLGMGLAISRSIVESHGGELTAAADDGHGATFRFSLPLYQQKLR